MKLYHGSNKHFENIDLSASKPGKDFGSGFYLSEDKEQAIDIARLRSAFLGGEACVHVFEYNQEAVNGCKLLDFHEYCTEWAQFVFDNRCNKSKKNIYDYDIVHGPIANDTIGYQVRRMMDGLIAIDQFLDEIKYIHGETFQYFFGSEKALAFLRKIEVEDCE